MVRDQEHAGGEIALKTAVWELFDLVTNTGVGGHVDFCGRPELGHGEDEDGHLAFSPGH